MICRAAIIGALYVVLTVPFGSFAYGPFQIRPAEALTILPLFYPEAIAGLYIGCIGANLLSNYGVYDVLLGSLATLAAAGTTCLIGIMIKNKVLKIILGGLPVVLFNAFVVPAVWLLAGSEIAYWVEFGVMCLNEAVWVYALGGPLYVTFIVLIRRKTRGLTPYCEYIKKNL